MGPFCPTIRLASSLVAVAFLLGACGGSAPVDDDVPTSDQVTHEDAPSAEALADDPYGEAPWEEPPPAVEEAEQTDESDEADEADENADEDIEQGD